MNELMGRSNSTNMVAVEESTSIAEIQAKMILARNFPRDVDVCLEYIKRECQNKELAEKATYEFPRGDSVVRGLSIRLVECVARHWGNLLSGIKEVSSNDKEATVKAYAWDLETNFADEKVFTVPYVRSSKQYGKRQLTDERDRYEAMANMAARRKRACMQAIIPQFVIDEAVEACQKTLEDGMKGKNIEDVKRSMLDAYRAKAEWITEADFETVIGKPFDTFSAKDIVKLRNLYNAINDGFVKPEVAFKRVSASETPDDKAAETLDEVNAMFAAGADNGTNEG